MATRLRKSGPPRLPAHERRRRHREKLRIRAAARRSHTIDVAPLRQLELMEVGTVGAVVYARFAPDRDIAPGGLLVLTNTELLGSDRRQCVRRAA
jgi:hypothetical protein